MDPYRLALALGGAAATAFVSVGAVYAHGPALIDDIAARAAVARDKAGGGGIAISFTTPQGWLTRHAILSGGDGLDDAVRARAAQAIAATPGVGGASWASWGRRGIGWPTAAKDALTPAPIDTPGPG